jgi:hypothetical protein
MEEGEKEENLILAMYKFQSAHEFLRRGNCVHYPGYVSRVIEVLERLLWIYEELQQSDNCSFTLADSVKFTKFVLRTFRLDNPQPTSELLLRFISSTGYSCWLLLLLEGNSSSKAISC